MLIRTTPTMLAAGFHTHSLLIILRDYDLGLSDPK